LIIRKYTPGKEKQQVGDYADSATAL